MIEEVLRMVAETLNGDKGFRVGVDSADFIWAEASGLGDVPCVGIKMVGPDGKRYMLLAHSVDT